MDRSSHEIRHHASAILNFQIRKAPFFSKSHYATRSKWLERSIKGFQIKKDVNRDSYIAFSPISQSSFFEEVRRLILASSQRKLRGHIEFFKFDIRIKKNFNQIRQNLKVSTDSRKI